MWQKQERRLITTGNAILIVGIVWLVCRYPGPAFAIVGAAAIAAWMVM